MEKQWQCSVCGYIHVGAEPPENCPVCGADRSKFVPLETRKTVAADSLFAVFKLHPVVAHFPAGLVPTAFLFLAVWAFFGNKDFEAAVFWLLVVATTAIPVSFGSGLYDWRKHFGGRKAPIFTKKIGLALTLFVLGSVAILLRYNNPALMVTDGWQRWLYAIDLLLMLGCVTLLGHYGSILAAQVASQQPAPGAARPDVSKEGWFRDIVTQSPDAILVADHAGIIRLWNRGAERIFGVPAERALGQSLDLIIPESMRQRHWEGWGKVMLTGKSRYGESQMFKVPALRGDGARFSAEFSIAMLKDGTGKVTGVAAILRDVSEQREREKQLQAQLASCREQ